jgi:hypothetical protein
MTDSSQQPTADCAAITNTLVNEIIELLTDMDIKGIDVSCERPVFQNLVRSMPTLSPEDGGSQCGASAKIYDDAADVAESSSGG